MHSPIQEDFLLFAEIDAILQILEKVNDILCGYVTHLVIFLTPSFLASYLVVDNFSTLRGKFHKNCHTIIAQKLDASLL